MGNNKPAEKAIFIRDPEAIRLVNGRARAERRSAANAAATTIIEALSNDKPKKQNWQGKIITKNSPQGNSSQAEIDKQLGTTKG